MWLCYVKSYSLGIWLQLLWAEAPFFWSCGTCGPTEQCARSQRRVTFGDMYYTRLFILIFWHLGLCWPSPASTTPPPPPPNCSVTCVETRKGQAQFDSENLSWHKIKQNEFARRRNLCLKAGPKEWNNTICSNMVESRDCYTEWKKSYREGQISYDIAFMWTLKKNGTNELIYNTEIELQM